MFFTDEDLNLIINDLTFKAFLEDSDIIYEAKDQQLPFVPTSFTNDSMAIRVTEKAKFTFNVFSETRYECVENYNNLQKLLKIIKPNYTYINDQLVPNFENVSGFINIKFKGLPSIGKKSIKLHLNNFSYTINKDLGYLHVPYSELNNPKNPSFYQQGEMKLIPIGYKISIEGKVLLQFEETANVEGGLLPDSVISLEDYSIYATQKAEQDKLDKLRKKVTDAKTTFAQYISILGAFQIWDVKNDTLLRQPKDNIEITVVEKLNDSMQVLQNARNELDQFEQELNKKYPNFIPTRQ